MDNFKLKELFESIEHQKQMEHDFMRKFENKLQEEGRSLSDIERHEWTCVEEDGYYVYTCGIEPMAFVSDRVREVPPYPFFKAFNTIIMGDVQITNSTICNTVIENTSTSDPCVISCCTNHNASIQGANV